jgi:hypothetical protein
MSFEALPSAVLSVGAVWAPLKPHIFRLMEKSSKHLAPAKRWEPTAAVDRFYRRLDPPNCILCEGGDCYIWHADMD